MGISKQPFQKRLDAAGKGLKGPSGSLGTGKKSSMQIPDSWQSQWYLQDNRWKGLWTLQGRVWRGAAVLEAEKKDSVQIPDSWKSHVASNRSKSEWTLKGLKGPSGSLGSGKKGLCADPRQLAIRRCRKGFEEARRQFGKRKKRALCRSATAGKAIGVCKTTGGKATGRCREGFEGAKRQSWKPKKGEKKLLQISDSWKSHWLLHATVPKAIWRYTLGTGKTSSVQISDSWKSHWLLHATVPKAIWRCRPRFGRWNRKKELCADPRQLGKPLAFATGRCREGLGAKRQCWKRKKKALCRSPTAGKAMGISRQPFQKRMDAAGKGLKGPGGSLGTGKKSSVQIPDSWKSQWQDNRWKGHWTLQGRVWRGQAAVLEAEKKALCRSPTAGKAMGKKKLLQISDSWKSHWLLHATVPKAIWRYTLGTGKTSSVQISDSWKSHWLLARNRSKGHLTLQAKVWALEPEKRALCRSPPTRETIGMCHRTLQGRVWRGQAAVLELERKALCRSPTAGKAIGVCKTTGGKATGLCREGFEGAKRQSWKRKKKALCRSPTAGKAMGISKQPFQKRLDGVWRGQAAVLEAEKKALCRSPTAGKGIGICKTTGGKATGRCREGIEGASRQSWNRKKKLCADPRQLEKPVAFARNRSKGHSTLQGRVWTMQGLVLKLHTQGGPRRRPA